MVKYTAVINLKPGEIEEVYQLLRSMNRMDLINDQLSYRSLTEVKKILSLPQWKDKKFQK